MESSPPSVYSRAHPFASRLLAQRLLSRPGSRKEIRHFVFDLEGSGLVYRTGMSLGVFASNPPSYVAELLAAGHFTGQESVTLPKAPAPVTLLRALSQELHLSWLTRKLLENLHAAATDPTEKEKLAALLSPSYAEELQKSFQDRFPVDFLREFPSARICAQQLVDSLKKLNPRLYSIASTPFVHPHRVELTVNIARCTSSGCPRQGVCSTFLADRLPIGSTVPVFLADSILTLPADDSAPLIMIGPGTGIAPFRAFLAERAARGASGRHWLFFGDQHRATDFLYEEEILAHQRSGLLTRLDLAWSRDQAHKVYVQDLMPAQAADLWSWLQAGAYLYICGDKQMGRDVEATLLQLISSCGGLDEAAAAQYLSELKKAGRYQKDVY